MAMFLFGCVEGQTTKTWAELNEKGFELNFKLGWRAIFNWRRTMLAPIFIFMGWSVDFIAYTYTRVRFILQMLYNNNQCRWSWDVEDATASPSKIIFGQNWFRFGQMWWDLPEIWAKLR